MKNLHVIKIGSNVLTTDLGSLDLAQLHHLVEQIAFLKKSGIPVVLVSSGAVASGRGLFPSPNSSDSISKRQLWASIGQVKLIQTYADFLAEFNLFCAQVLVTKEDFRDRTHYLNMKNCFSALLENGVIPVVNENDVISVTELMFTDNDELAGLVASMVNAEKLIILTNVDGVYSKNPTEADAFVIPEIGFNTNQTLSFDSAIKSNFGRGGMLTKFSMAKKTAALGIPVQIANGKRRNVLLEISKNQEIGTIFKAKKTASSTKKWLAHANSAFSGALIIDDGAKKALFLEKPTSLLPIGVNKVEGDFKKGDIVQIKDLKGVPIGLGKTHFDSNKAKELMGQKNQKAIIHYDYLYLHSS